MTNQRLIGHDNRALESRSLVFLAVCREVERDEQHKIRAEDAAARDRGELLARTRAGVWQPRPVRISEVRPAGKIDKDCVSRQPLALSRGEVFSMDTYRDR